MGVNRRGATATSGGPGTRRGIPLRAYVVALVLLFVAVAGVNVLYQRQAARADARNAALAGASFGARTAAREIGADLGGIQAQVASLAADPAIRQAFVAPANCALRFAAVGSFTTGHLDLVRGDGTVACSSLAPRNSPGYTGAAWLASARARPAVTGPIADVRTGQQVVVLTAPVPGRGVVAAFLNLDPVGPDLAAILGGPRHLEFLVTTASGATILARSADPAFWVGKPVAGTPFAGAMGGSEHRDLAGTPRLYGSATLAGAGAKPGGGASRAGAGAKPGGGASRAGAGAKPGGGGSTAVAGWRVFAGASAAQAFAAADQLSNRQLLITLVGLAVFLLGALVLYVRIAGPIGALSAGVRTATGRLPAEPITVAGPAEVSALTDDFNQLIAAANRELAARSQLAAIADSSADAIVGMTLEGVVTSWNAGAELMSGYSREEMIGTSVSVLFPPGQAGELATVLEQVGRGERVENFDARHLRKDNSIIEMSYTISPVRDGAGAVTRAAAVARDVTERNRAEADRRALEHRLRQSERLESLGQLAGGIAHDFNNLLAAIMNYAGFVAEETADRPEVRADVEQITAAAERAAKLTRQLLIFGRRESAQREVFDLNAIVADVHSLLSRSLGEHIELSISPAAGLPPIEADRGQIEQVLLNLAINARDAMPSGGVLTIETSPAELDEDYASTHPGASPGYYVELSASDTGTGMSADIAARIFEPFFTTKPRGKGTGLGLSTVYGIVAQAGGSVSVESEEGTGTTFRLYFPVAGAPTPVPPPRTEADLQGHGETILVVDDEPAVLAVTARILRQHGYRTLEAASFEEAMVIAAANDFQLLLTDSVMPQMSGTTLAERVAELIPGLAVLYMSGYSQAAPGPYPARPDGTASIAKPFTSQALLHAVDAALNPKAP